MCRLRQIKSNNSKVTQKQIRQHLGQSVSTIKRYRDQINMSRPCNKNNTKRRKMNPQKTSVKTSQIKGGK